VLAALPAGIKIASFAEGYRRYFEIVPATTETLRWHNYHIRHEVYCREFGFGPIRADEIEVDAYDARSVHCLVRALASQEFVGCSRIVLTDPASPAAPLPFEQIAGHLIDRSILDPSRMDRARIGEISRMAVVNQYRRRKGEHQWPFSIDDSFGDNGRVRLPYMTFGLLLAMIVLARWKGIGTLFMLAEPPLAAGIAHLGIELHMIGSAVDHRGMRVPAALFVDEIVAHMDARIRPLFDTISEEIQRALEAASL
jgi:N-acyl amino acid synthase of PEP-CTERM/exosortase system